MSQDSEQAAFLLDTEAQTGSGSQEQVESNSGQAEHEEIFSSEKGSWIWVLAHISSLLFLIFLALKLDGNILDAVRWVHLCSLFLFVLFVYNIAIVTDIWNSQAGLKSLAKTAVFILTTAIILLVGIFSILFSLKLDGSYHSSFQQLFVPLYVLAGVALCFICFLLPGYLYTEDKHYKEVILIVMYYVCSILTIANVSLKLDKLFDGSFVEAISPMIVAGAVHVVILVGVSCWKKSITYEKELIVVLFAYASTIMTAVNFDFDEDRHISWKIAFIPVYLLTIIGCISSFADCWRKS